MIMKKESIIKRRYLCMLISLLFFVSCSDTQINGPSEEFFETYGNIKIGPLTRVYEDSQMPYTMDASWATLKNPDGTITFFETAMGKSPYYYRHTGPLDNPLQTELSPYVFDYNGYNNTWPSGCWISNIYKVSDDLLIGITHREDLYPANGNSYGKDCYYIGLSSSRDGGNSWKYIGDVISVRGNLSTDPQSGSNVAGCPILVVGDYLYVYYDETNDSDFRASLSVARTKISDLVAAVRQDKIVPFFKYYEGTWEQPGINGFASCVIPDFQVNYDFHSDAVYCQKLGKYLITVQTHDLGKLLLYQSVDGINWEQNPITLDFAEGFMHPYSCFVGFGDEGNEDGTRVDKIFYVYICRKKVVNYEFDEIYYRKILIE